MSQSAIGALLDSLSTARAPEAWTEFLALYSDSIYKTARLTTPDPETAADCYLYICEQLSQNRFQRLLRFRPTGPARFETWLAVVARNLCLDWLRKKHGRQRAFRCMERLNDFENEIYRLHVQQGMSLEETFHHLQTRHPGVTHEDLEAADARVQQALSSRHRWLLGQRSAERAAVSIDTAEEEGAAAIDPEDPRASPELALLEDEDRIRLTAAMATLEPRERLLIRLRFEEELSLAEIARLTGAADAQRAHYQLNQALEKLRNRLRGKSLEKARTCP